VKKRFVPYLDRSAVKAVYQVSHQGDDQIRMNFGIEFNINFLSGNAPDRYYEIPGHRLEDQRLRSFGELEGVLEVGLTDEWAGIKAVLKADQRFNLWRFPVETVSLSESGFEKIYQGSCLLLYWPLELKPKEQFEVTIELGIEHL